MRYHEMITVAAMFCGSLAASGLAAEPADDAVKRELERQRRQINQKIKLLIKEHAVRDDAADKKRNFLYKGRIRSVLATTEQINEINNGSLGVAYLSGNYHLLPTDKIEEIRQFAPDHIPNLAGSVSEDEKENPVPDDLIW